MAMATAAGIAVPRNVNLKSNSEESMMGTTNFCPSRDTLMTRKKEKPH
jgi:hypothetical protein